MGYDIFTILEACGILAFAFWLIGFVALMVAVQITRREFRVKGYLKPPSGREWFHFLLWKQYDHFENPNTRFFFGAAHFCLIGMFIASTALVVLLGSEALLKNMSGLTSGLPDVSQPK